MTTSINPHRLYRNSKEGMLAGVCAGIADYFDINVRLIRLAVILGFVMTSGLVICAYIALALILKRKPRKLYRSSEEETFWRGVANAPRMTLSELKYKFMNLNEKLKKMEDHVTSSEYELEQKYKKL